VVWAFTAHVSLRQTAQLDVDQRHEPIEGSGLATSPGQEQRRGAVGLFLDALILRPIFRWRALFGRAVPPSVVMTIHHPPRRLHHLAIRVVLIASVCGLAPPARAGSDDPAIARVRSSDPSLAALIDRAAARSATFQRLVASIEGGHGIVYVEAGTCSHGVHACLKMWMKTVGPNRFLRIAIDSSKIGSDAERMGLIGHELQHAVEALSESGVTDSVSLYNFFSRLAPTDASRFETTDALRAGDTVQREMR
jgi:hypothetical protein